MKFSLNSYKKYADDPNEEKFEIVSAGGKQYLGFVLTVVERAHSFDEAVMFEKVEIGLKLMPDHLASLTEINNFPVSVLVTVLVLLVSLGGLWYVLPLNIKDLLQGIQPKVEEK